MSRTARQPSEPSTSDRYSSRIRSGITRAHAIAASVKTACALTIIGKGVLCRRANQNSLPYFQNPPLPSPPIDRTLTVKSNR
eukprot:1800147-Pleurochrysis_carterae.AAC.4